MSFTIAIKFSRSWCLDPFFKRFKELQFDRTDCNLILINNTSDFVLSVDMLEAISPEARFYKSLHFIQTNNPHFTRYQSENRIKVPAPFPTWSSYYSFSMHKRIAKLLQDNIHIQLEDDTLPPVDAIQKLLKMIIDPEVAMSAIPCAQRESALTTVGHNSYEKITKDETGLLIYRLNTPVFREGVKEIVGTGYHCVAIKKDPFLKAIDYVEKLPFTFTGSGSDVYFTSFISETCGKILCDFSSWCDHLHNVNNHIISLTADNCKPWEHTWNPKKEAYNWVFVDKPNK